MILTDQNVSDIEEFLNLRLVPPAKRVKTMKLIEHMHSKMENLEEASFRLGLREAFDQGKLNEFTSRRGRYGGIYRKADLPAPTPVKVNVETFAAAKPIKQAAPVICDAPLSPPLEPSPLDLWVDRTPKIRVKEKTYPLTLNGKEYHHTMTSLFFAGFMKKIIDVSPSEEGNLSAFGEQYELNEEQADLLDRLLFYCFEASYVI